MFKTFLGHKINQQLFKTIISCTSLWPCHVYFIVGNQRPKWPYRTCQHMDTEHATERTCPWMTWIWKSKGSLKQRKRTTQPTKTCVTARALVSWWQVVPTSRSGKGIKEMLQQCISRIKESKNITNAKLVRRRRNKIQAKTMKWNADLFLKKQTKSIHHWPDQKKMEKTHSIQRICSNRQRYTKAPHKLLHTVICQQVGKCRKNDISWVHTYSLPEPGWKIKPK